jgi:hypothetical protein
LREGVGGLKASRVAGFVGAEKPKRDAWKV